MSRKRANGEGSIYRRSGDGLWCATHRGIDGKLRVFGGKTQREAVAKREVHRQAVQLGVPETRARQSTAAFLTRWLEDSVRPTVRPQTYVGYEAIVRRHLIPEVGGVPIAGLGPQHLQRLYASKLGAGLSTGTVHQIHVVTHRALAQAVRFGLLLRNPAGLVDVKRSSDPRRHPFSPGELQSLMIAIRGHRHEQLWVLLLHTGMRFSEAAALRWSDVDPRREQLAIGRTLSRAGGMRFGPPKSAASRRVIPLGSVALEALDAQRRRVVEMRLLKGADWEDPEDLVFPSDRAQPLNESSVLKSFHLTLSQAAIPSRRLHDLRATFATQLSAQGEQAHVVKQLLGHARVQEGDSYVGELPENLRSAVAKLGRRLEDTELPLPSAR